MNLQPLDIFGEPCRDRTDNLLIKSQEKGILSHIEKRCIFQTYLTHTLLSLHIIH